MKWETYGKMTQKEREEYDFRFKFDKSKLFLPKFLYVYPLMLMLVSILFSSWMTTAVLYHPGIDGILFDKLSQPLSEASFNIAFLAAVTFIFLIGSELFFLVDNINKSEKWIKEKGILERR